MNQLITIIIPTYNRVFCLGETLDSILEQSYKNWECLVIDDGSTDRTSELLKIYMEKDSRIQFHKRPFKSPKGANSCRNYGFEISNGDYINFFDDDDLMHPEKLERQLSTLKDSKFDATICAWGVFTKDLEQIIKNVEFSEKETTFFNFITGNVHWLILQPLWNRKFLAKQKYLFDEELQAAQEWEFTARMLYNGARCDLLNEKLCFIREHEQSITYNANQHTRQWNYFLARLKIYRLLKQDRCNIEFLYLKKYLNGAFKKMLRVKNPYAIKSWKNYILTQSEFSFLVKFKCLLAIFTYRYFNKGDFLLASLN